MASDYHFEKPSIELDQGIYSFLQEFYRISDTPEVHDDYAAQFKPDATMFLGNKRSSGRAEIRALREGMWTNVSARKHKVQRVFASAPGTPEVMLYGQVAYDLKDGSKSSLDWAARCVLEKSAEDGKWRFAFYQVYLDMSK